MVLRLLVGARFQALFHSPHRGSFHLSLTVLVHYRSPRVFSLGGWSPLLPTGFPVSRGTQAHRPEPPPFAYGAFTLSGGPFQGPSARVRFVTPWEVGSPPCRGLQPRRNIGLPATKSRRFGLFPVRSPLLGESRLISFPRGTKMFQFPHLPSPPYGFRRRCPGITPGGFPHSGIPGSTPAWRLPGAYRSLATPFVGPWCQGIHRAPLVAWPRQASSLGKIEPAPVQLLRCDHNTTGPGPAAGGAPWTRTTDLGLIRTAL